MKKLGLASLALAGAFALAGCSCGNQGTYKLYSVSYGNVEYVCAQTDNEDAKSYCKEGGTVEVKSKRIAMVSTDEKTNSTMTMEADYKVEDGKLFVKEADSSKEEGWDWDEVGTMADGVITYTYDYGFGVKVTLTYKK